MGRSSQRGIKTHWFHILVALADEDRHGNGIVREILEKTEGQLRIWPVMLYRCLDEMTDEGLVTELTDAEDRPPGKSERRRYFRITKKGLSVLSEETERLSALVDIARSKMEPNKALSE